MKFCTRVRSLPTVFGALLILLFLNLTAYGQAFGASPNILWNFGNGTDGASPEGLIRDTKGNIYGTTQLGGTYGGTDASGNNIGGTAFELTPPSIPGGTWTESVLWSFGNGTDGTGPGGQNGQVASGGLIMDTHGNLYGTTGGGGTYARVDQNGNPSGGTAFELTPPSISGGKWTESILWDFANGMDGNYPGGPLIMDAGGNLYGTTGGGGTDNDGTVFELMHPSTLGGSWTESILWSFNGTDGQSPNSALIMDADRNLYGTTGGGGTGGGTVFELTPPSSTGGNWTQSILWSFPNPSNGEPDGSHPEAGLTMDAGGHLYGTTFTGGRYLNIVPSEADNPGGTAFELTPPSKSGRAWTESVIWNFGNGDGTQPFAAPIIDSKGNLYGTTFSGGASGPLGSGTVFKLTPPSTARGKWTESVLVDFSLYSVASRPDAAVIMDTSGNLYGTSTEEGTYGGGTTFQIPPQTVLKASPTKLNFGKVDEGKTSRPKRVTLRNNGPVAAVISLVLANALTQLGQFTIADGANTCSGETIAPKKTCSFEVEFAPTIAGGTILGVAGVGYNGASPEILLQGDAIAKK